MLTLDDRPTPPTLPQFSRDMEQFLVTAARTRAARRPTAAPRRSRGRYVVAGLAAAAVAAAAAIGIEHATNGGPHTPRANETGGPSASQSGGVHIHLAAFAVDTNPGGTVTLKLIQGRRFDPGAVREALARAHVPAVVTVGSVCTVPGRPSNGLPQVISRSPAANGQSVTTITPSAIPAGEQLSIGDLAVPNGGDHLYIGLVPVNTPLTCTSTAPAPPHHGNGPSR